MDEAQSLFRQGVLALREQRDAATARQLLMESLRLNPNNEMAWLWLSRTTSDPAKQRQCVDRALKINPHNEQALALREKMQDHQPSMRARDDMPPPAAVEEDEEPPPPRIRKLSAAEQRKIGALLEQADELVGDGDIEGAIANWVHVLQLQPDHEVAMRNAVGYLSRLQYLDDARELVWRAIDAGTTHPSIYLTALDIARVQGSSGEATDLQQRMLKLPEADDALAARLVERLIKEDQGTTAIHLAEQALTRWPDSPRLLVLMGELHEMLDMHVDAARFYDRAARRGAGTSAGRVADKKMRDSAPVMSDRERGSLTLALREALGIGVVFLVLAVQDAGLNLLNLGPMRWVGVLAALIGGYLIVSATSSPQQRPLAGWLGGTVPERQPEPARPEVDNERGSTRHLVEEPTTLPIIPPLWRVLLGAMGLAVLAVAFYLVFGTSLRLLLNPVRPNDLLNIADLLY